MQRAAAALDDAEDLVERAVFESTHEDHISVVDLETEEVIKTIATGSLPGHSGYYGVAISPDGSVVYANTCCGLVRVISTETHAVVDSVRVFEGRGAVAFTPDGAYAWVANPNYNWITVINTATLKRTSTRSLPATQYAIGITIAPDLR